jgi:hypothetical protein
MNKLLEEHKKSEYSVAVRKMEMLSNLTGGLLWNMNIEKIDYLRDKKLIIERIIESGMEKDEIIMWKLYSYEDIKNVAINMENLHKDDVTYMAFVLKIKEDEFKCYGKKMWYEK